MFLLRSKKGGGGGGWRGGLYIIDMICYCSLKSVTLTLGILETPKWVLWQAVKIQFGSSSLAYGPLICIVNHHRLVVSQYCPASQE